MSYEETNEILKEYGYVLECFHPLEISTSDNDRATGHFADLIIDMIEKKEKRISKKKK